MAALAELICAAARDPDYQSWQPFFRQAAAAPYFEALDRFVSEQMETHTVFPPRQDILNAFRLCPADRVRCILIGQDPYHEPGQAMGLAFSVREGVKPPPSLRNIMAEAQTDAGVCLTGDLSGWAGQGVFLLNTVLTVNRGTANSHAKRGWEQFTQQAVLYVLTGRRGPVAAILWGKPAERFRPLVLDSAAPDAPRYVVASAHPSPLSAYRGFFGSRPFSQVNAWLQSQGVPGIDWGA